MKSKLIEALNASFSNYKKYGQTSKKKVEPIYKFLQSELSEIWGPEFDFVFDSDQSKRIKVKGRYFDKNVPFSIVKDSVVVAVVNVNLIMSSFKKNEINSFESLLGQVSNIQANGMPYFNINILLKRTPVLDKDGVIMSYDILTDKIIEKYILLSSDKTVHCHSPYNSTLIIINADNGVVLNDNNSCFEEDVCSILNGSLSIDKFISSMVELKSLFNLKRK